MTSFSHLHVHSEYSLLNGMCRIKELVAQAKAQGMPAIALTDYGNIFGGVDLFSECQYAGIKPVLGCELFLPSFDDHTLKQFRRNQDSLWNLVVLVQNQQGYRNLSQMLSKAYLEGFYYKPRIDSKMLKDFNEGLIVLSSGFHSEINHHIMNEDEVSAIKAAERLGALFPGRFYVELQDNGLAGQDKVNRALVGIAKKVGLPVVATNNIHYVCREDAEAFEVLMNIQLSRIQQGPFDAKKFLNDGYYFKTSEEMTQTFTYIPEALTATAEIIKTIDFAFDFKTYHFPKYEAPTGVSLDDFLVQEAWRGLEDRWEQIKLISKKSDSDRPAYEERLQIELECIKKMGFSGYFLIVSDFITWAKNQNIPVGPGRGSAAGSLVAYCVRITDLDPIPYNLLFERFLNPERISMPDVDVDFCQYRRGEVIDYVSKKYGNVSQIITFGKMKAKAVLRDVGRVMGLEYDVVDKIAKLIPTALNITLAEALEQEERLKDLYDGDATVKKLIDTSLRLEGLNRHASVHAAGVVITDKPLWEFVPLYKGSNDDVVTHFDMKYLEKIGLIKFDFLGLKTLTVIHWAVENIKKARGIAVDMTKISLTDELVYQALSSGDGTGVFQLESSGMRDLMVRLSPGTFEDIVALVALYRPGPLGSGMVDDFIERKKGRKDLAYEVPELEVILKDTYGVIVYQEQVMQIAAALASYSLGEADLLRRAMGKKKADEMDAQRKRFMEGAERNKINAEKAGRIFDLMAMFAEYGFNKSHSAAYALVSYQTAFLKTHYCEEYMAALMTSEMEDTDKLLMLIQDCKVHEIQVLPPDINMSESRFTVVGPKTIRYALAALKGVGEAAIDSMVEARTKEGLFKSVFDFCLRVDLRRVSKKVMEILIKSGAMDGFGLSRKALLGSIEFISDSALQRQKNARSGQNDLFAGMESAEQIPVNVEVQNELDWTQREKLAFEKEAFGYFFSDHPLRSYEEALHKVATHSIAALAGLPREKEVTIGGYVLTSRAILTKKGDRMAFVQIEDLSGKIEAIVFPKTFKKYGDFLASGDPLVLKGTIDQSDEGVKLIVEEIHSLIETLKNNVRSIHLSVPLAEWTQKKSSLFFRILDEHKGQSAVVLHLHQLNDFEAVLDFPKERGAIACDGLQYHLNQLFDGKVVRFE